MTQAQTLLDNITAANLPDDPYRALGMAMNKTKIYQTSAREYSWLPTKHRCKASGKLLQSCAYWVMKDRSRLRLDWDIDFEADTTTYSWMALPKA